MRPFSIFLHPNPNLLAPGSASDQLGVAEEDSLRGPKFALPGIHNGDASSQ